MDVPRSTPTAGLYVLAVAASVLTLVTGIAVVMAVSVALAGAPADALTLLVLGWGYGLIYGSVLALPLACVGVPVIHLLCRDREKQSTQVVITGVVSLALVLGIVGAASAGGGSGGEGWVVGLVAGLPVAASTMVGRAAVIPLVRRRQRTAVRFDRSNSQIRVG